MVDGGAVNTWTCINFASDITHAAAVAFCDELAVMCLVSGMVGFFVIQIVLSDYSF